MDTTTPAGKALFQMMGVAEFERAMVQERVKAGLERARAQGKQLGRPTVSAEVARIAELRGEGGQDQDRQDPRDRCQYRAAGVG